MRNQRVNRKTTPRVVDGKVQRKNRSALTPSYWNTPQEFPVIDRERPGPGHRHLLKKRDIENFISILPDWSELSKGLDAILLARYEQGTAGWHTPGIVGICAWERELHVEQDLEFFNEHKGVYDRIGVEYEPVEDGMLCRFTENQAKAYQLLHILLHELGHHHDRMTTRSKREAARGENYAEQYALTYEKVIWNRYVENFDL